MNFFNDAEMLMEESTALFDCYLERVFESETVNDLISASHWYADAFYCLVTNPNQRG